MTGLNDLLKQRVPGSGQFISAKPCRIIKDGDKGFRVITQAWEKSGYKTREAAQAVYDEYIELWGLGNRFILGR